MEKNELLHVISQTFSQCPGNVIDELEGLVLFDAPLTGVARADDSIFASFRDDESIIGSHYMLPSEWLPAAQFVVSIFFPFSEAVRLAERRAGAATTSVEWLYGRVEGQEFIAAFTRMLCERLAALGVKSCAPSLDDRFKIIPDKFSSNWSERHAAYACGLGTFGLSRGIITSRGMAGRLSSVILDAELEADTRSYTRHDEYCIMCGACVRRCPVHAISLEHGKDQLLCAGRMQWTRKEYAPRYGCGKCQTLVPCEFKRP